VKLVDYLSHHLLVLLWEVLEVGEQQEQPTIQEAEEQQETRLALVL
jgi:hypothetical protein